MFGLIVFGVGVVIGGGTVGGLMLFAKGKIITSIENTVRTTIATEYAKITGKSN